MTEQTSITMYSNHPKSFCCLHCFGCCEFSLQIFLSTFLNNILKTWVLLQIFQKNN